MSEPMAKIGGTWVDVGNVDAVRHKNCQVCGAHVYLQIVMRGGTTLDVGEVYYQDELDGPWDVNKARFYARVQQRVAEIAEAVNG